MGKLVCKVCGSDKVTATERKVVLRCHNCGWVKKSVKVSG